MEIWLIRHTSVNVEPGTAYGQSDVPLKDTFNSEAAEVASKIEGISFDRVFTSPLSRCTKLAEFCGYGDAEREKRILEIDFGEWEMRKFNEIGDMNLQKWYEDYINVRATGGESFKEQYERVSSFLENLKNKPYNRVAIFTHGGVIICAQAYAGICNVKEAFSQLTPYGGIIKIYL